ncbi:hypothetical protein CH330_04280 [candidate division WOR-3 bacterium JGI_Cruoil_03_51_56]|uniref:DNA mismatch repair protein MutL n=1 Tax=candidate division WOR-3 bacterium JGI_Cruoil_03_51_56 TaxID=1973747 RepID=A0A235BVT9_UNCW3|nr:MAG: hypothetical protein CH330_04280 [candidate division WOR-3 bacterium JGI_Cruoil_03_51_56]
MNPIKLLPEETVRRIAAGEVITRPTAAVKELIENSLDAGATEIKIEVKAGGKNLIKVNDNGSGMERDDVRLAVARHATSKLDGIEDLKSLRSYGFRGEALASIAAVSRLTIETNVNDAEPGTRLEVDGGDIREIAETAYPRGTTVTARTLFFNLPARRSFLKSDNYELKLVVETVKGYAAAYPEIVFELISNGRTLFCLPKCEGMKKRLKGLYDRQTIESFVRLKVDNPLLSLSGFLAEPSQTKNFYEVEAVYINRRPVRNRTVVRAICDGYGPVLRDRRPNFIIFIETDPAKLDVNIHPTKQEVRFADERFLFDFISEAVRQVLGTRHDEQTGVDEFLYQRSLETGMDASAQGFWQLHNSYILAQVISGYVIVDQHAAHERILFEEITRQRRHVSPQGLLFPITLELSPEQFAAYEQSGKGLARMGMETKVFSGRTVVVETVPAGAYMGKGEIKEFFAELADVSSGNAVPEVELAKLISCKAAIKFGQRLSQPEMESLINRLFACDEPHFCPHGRPTIIKVTLEELGRKFGRT